MELLSDDVRAFFFSGKNLTVGMIWSTWEPASFQLPSSFQAFQAPTIRLRAAFTKSNRASSSFGSSALKIVFLVASVGGEVGFGLSCFSGAPLNWSN